LKIEFEKKNRFEDGRMDEFVSLTPHDKLRPLLNQLLFRATFLELRNRVCCARSGTRSGRRLLQRNRRRIVAL